MFGWDQYEILGSLGKGKYGAVCRARHRKLGNLVALKSVINLSGKVDDNNPSNLAKQRNFLYREAEILAKLSHPSLVSLIEICVNADGELVIAMEDLGATSLTDLIDTELTAGLCPVMVGCILNHIGNAVTYMHTSGFLHRDIKPENIMVENNKSCFRNAKLIDFGLSIPFSMDALPNTSSNRAGTLPNMAPEMMYPNTSYGTAVDVFSLGTCIFFALTGVAPFIAFTSKGRQKMTTSVYGFQAHHNDILDKLPEEVRKVVVAMLETNVTKRCSVSDALASEWVVRSCQQGKDMQNYVSELNFLDSWLTLHHECVEAPNKCIHCPVSASECSSIEDSSSDYFDTEENVSEISFANTEDDNSYYIQHKKETKFCKVLGFAGDTCGNKKLCLCSTTFILDSSIVSSVAKVLQKDQKLIQSNISQRPWGIEGGMYNILKIDDTKFFKTENPIHQFNSKHFTTNDEDWRTKSL